ncbi:hypothetical protein Q9233_017633 [Columba guinea]|nr:hypothetical protein Q9233_017633 [Columba guinea]
MEATLRLMDQVTDVLGNAYVSLFFGGGQNPQDAQRALGAYAQAERVDPKAANNPDLHLNRATHGRLKLRPPDASYLLKRQHKLRLFLDNMAALRDKRSRGELDADLLEVTGSILAANPETGTAWSLRRRLLGTLGHQWQEEELRFVSACLSRSPKSYGCWQHRGWVLGQTDAKAPAISTGMLDSDPRNSISDASALTPLAACPQLRRIRLADTPLAAVPESSARLAQLLPQVTIALA